MKGLPSNPLMVCLCLSLILPLTPLFSVTFFFHWCVLAVRAGVRGLGAALENSIMAGMGKNRDRVEAATADGEHPQSQDVSLLVRGGERGRRKRRGGGNAVPLSSPSWLAPCLACRTASVPAWTLWFPGSCVTTPCRAQRSVLCVVCFFLFGILSPFLSFSFQRMCIVCLFFVVVVERNNSLHTCIASRRPHSGSTGW